MFPDAVLPQRLEAMLDGIVAPPAPLDAIRSKMLFARSEQRQRARSLRVALVAASVIAVLACVAMPMRSVGLVQAIEARYRAALRALGGEAPPPAPAALVSHLISHDVTLTKAQSHVNFTIVPPVGLPPDVVAVRIVMANTGVYSRTWHTWTVGPPSVTFVCRRRNGNSFQLLADRFDPHEGSPPKYLFEAKDDAQTSGPLVLVRHEHFAWRNGDQVMSATESNALRASEIESIRAAMHGIALPRRNLHAPETPEKGKLYIVP
ncbi:MAG: hypothetical protein JO043_08210 [Candidatus Eremiobacteraeota bacterium]|nr:hypothetical protein [Candidatus Eremiobacteraeota bacterium]